MRPNSILYLDLSVSEADFHDGARQILSHIRPTWKAEDIQFKIFTDGITNKLMGCHVRGTESSGTRRKRNGESNAHTSTSSSNGEVGENVNDDDDDDDDDDTVLVRVNGRGTDIIINRKEEQQTFRLLSEASLAPPVYCVFDNGMAYGFFPGQPLDEQTVRLPKIQRLIAEEMVKLHRVPGPCQTGRPQSELRARTQAFLDSAPTSFEDGVKQKLFVSTIPSKPQLQRELDTIMDELDSLGMEAVFSHNDLLLKNIVYNDRKGTIRFIDYEYAFYNYEAFDIADHFAEYAGLDEVDYNLYPSKEEQLPWLRHYLQYKAEAHGKSRDTVTPNDVERFYLQVNKSVCAAHFYWGIWALIQAEHSAIDFDYVSYANIRLTEYFRRKEEFFPLKLPV